MKVIVDNKIPYIKGLIETLADEVIYLPGKDFTPEVVKELSALVHSVTASYWKAVRYNSSEQPPSASTTSTQNTVRKPASHGATAPDAMPEP